MIVADDAALFRGGLARLLADRGIEVTAEVGDAEALLAAVRADPPDAVIVDIRMPPTHTTEGLDAARTLAAEHPAVGVLVLSAHVESHYAVALVEADAGGAGYLLKERVADVEELTDALRRVVAGGVVVDPSVVAQLVGRRRVRNPLDTLSERERDVLAVMAEGRSNAGIGDRLHLSEKTVEAYARSAFTKLDLHAARGRQPAGARGAGVPALLSRRAQWNRFCAGSRPSTASASMASAASSTETSSSLRSAADQRLST